MTHQPFGLIRLGALGHRYLSMAVCMCQYVLCHAFSLPADPPGVGLVVQKPAPRLAQWDGRRFRAPAAGPRPQARSSSFPGVVR